MKTKRRIILTVLIIAVAVTVAGLFVIKSVNDKNYRFDASLYFFDDKKASIIEEVHEIKYDNINNVPRAIIDALINGPVNKKCVSPISHEAEILSIVNEEGQLTVDFSREFLSGDSSQDILATYAVIKSLCSANNVTSVKITVEGSDITAPDGNIIGYLSSSDINISNSDDSNDAVILYFPSKTTQKLVTEVRNIESKDKQTTEQYIVSEIMKGPQNKNLQEAIAPDTSLISVETKDGICYVNFKSNFIDKNSGDKERLAIYSIVNSLTETEGIHQVQFLIDGKKVENFGQTGTDGLFIRNETLIEKSSAGKQ